MQKGPLVSIGIRPAHALPALLGTVLPPDVRPTASFSGIVAGSGSYSFSANAKDRDFAPTAPGSDKGIAMYVWDFGDLTAPSPLEDPVHEYLAPDAYLVTLFVADDDPLSAGGSKTSVGKLSVVESVRYPAVKLETSSADNLAGCVSYDDMGNRIGPPFTTALVATAVDPHGDFPIDLTYNYVGVPFGWDGDPANLIGPFSGIGLTSIDVTFDEAQNVTFVLFVTDSSGLQSRASLTVDVEVCGQSAYDLPSFQIVPSDLHKFLNGAPEPSITFTPTIDVEGGAGPPEFWTVVWDFDNDPTDPADFEVQAMTAMGDRSVDVSFLKPGRYYVLARSVSSMVPGLFVEASSTIDIDVGKPTAQITAANVAVICSKFKPTFAISFSGAGMDPDGGTVSYEWEIADSGGAVVGTSNSSSGAINLPGPGSYTLELTVTDDEGQTALAQAVRSVMKVLIP